MVAIGLSRHFPGRFSPIESTISQGASRSSNTATSAVAPGFREPVPEGNARARAGLAVARRMTSSRLIPKWRNFDNVVARS